MIVFNQATAEQVMYSSFPPFVLAFGLKPEAVSDDGKAVLRMPVNASACRQDGIMSGQALASLADTAMVCALWAAFGEVKPAATVDLHVTFLRGAKNEELLAQAEVVKLGRGVSFAKAVIISPSNPDKPIATAVGTFAMPG